MRISDCMSDVCSSDLFACLLCFFKRKRAIGMRISDWSSDVCSSDLAVLLLGAIGAGSTAGRFFLGEIADRMGRRPFLVCTFAGMALALTVWTTATSLWTLAVFALLFGLFYGGWVAVLPAVVVDQFGGRNASGLLGILYTSVRSEERCVGK